MNFELMLHSTITFVVLSVVVYFIYRDRKISKKIENDFEEAIRTGVDGI